MKKYTIWTLTFSFILLLLSGLLIVFEAQYTVLKIPRMIIGSIIVLFIPGYWITRWSFPLTDNEKILDPIDENMTPKKEDDDGKVTTIDGLERFVLSVALSISSVPLLLFYVNFL